MKDLIVITRTSVSLSINAWISNLLLINICFKHILFTFARYPNILNGLKWLLRVGGFDAPWCWGWWCLVGLLGKTVFPDLWGWCIPWPDVIPFSNCWNKCFLFSKHPALLCGQVCSLAWQCLRRHKANSRSHSQSWWEHESLPVLLVFPGT